MEEFIVAATISWTSKRVSVEVYQSALHQRMITELRLAGWSGFQAAGDGPAVGEEL